MKLRNSLIYLLIASFLIAISPAFDSNSLVLAKKKTSSKVVKSSKKSKSAKSTKSTKSSKKSKNRYSKKGKKSKHGRRTRYESRRVVNTPPSHVFVTDTLLSDGVLYKRIHLSMNGYKHDVHVIQSDLNNPFCSVEILKAHENNTELEKVHNIVYAYDSLNPCTLAGAVNANFWKAYTNYPIGPVIIGGEIVELPSYKKWSSTFFNYAGKPFIDYFELYGSLKPKKGRSLDIDLVNRRNDTMGIVLYNRYAGDTIPYITTRKAKELISKSIDNLEYDTDFNDSTEAEFDTEKLRKELISSQRAATIEYSLPKIVVKYLEDPAINRNTKAVVIDYKTSAVAVPQNGCVISFGRDISRSDIPQIGDTIAVNFRTNVYKNEIFKAAVSGTPRLVRDGVASQEAQNEGSHGRRFIKGILPRTAIGYDKSKKKIFIVSVKGNSKYGTDGANLDQMAKIMKYIGCYNAMNLDGGGSTVMVINNKNVLNEIDTMSSRKVSVGIGVVKKCNADKTIGLKK